MAGRPLRRLRNALRLNPLVGWEDESEYSTSTVSEPYAPLVQKGARDRYAEVYNKVDLPLSVLIRSGRRGGQRSWDSEMAAATSSILLVVAADPRGAGPFYREAEQRRGSSDRVAPFTPFVLLHRLADVSVESSKIRPSLAPFLLAYENAYARTGMQKRPAPERARFLSRGVDTAAGRMGVLTVDFVSDLFAKYLLTGRIAYSPNVPPSESEKEQEYRETLAHTLPRMFKAWEEALRDSVPSVFYCS